MGAGRGAKRRERIRFGTGALRRAKLDPLRRGRAIYTQYSEALSFRTATGDACWLYRAHEYSAGLAGKPRTYLMLVDEHDLFWAVGAREAAAVAPDLRSPLPPLEPVSFTHAIYWSASRNELLRERHGTMCLVYAVEEQRQRGARVPTRYGIRFPDDDSYWVVPAREIYLAPAYDL